MRPMILGLCGGSCSGKTTLARLLVLALGTDRCRLLRQDNYYKDQSARFDRDGGSVNFDHPDAIDFELLTQHLSELKQGKTIDLPMYDFVTHTRSPKREAFVPTEIVLVDGILILTQDPLVEVLDHSVYIECQSDLRLERRLARDTVERGRTREGVVAQFQSQVDPMHKQFVEPSKAKADLVIGQKEYLECQTTVVNKVLAHMGL